MAKNIKKNSKYEKKIKDLEERICARNTYTL